MTGARRRRRWWSAAAMVGVSVHHAIEALAGLGVPGQPLVGPRAARLVWSAAIPAHIAVALTGGPRWDRPLAFTNGAVVALAVQHYLTWPWRWRRGVPVITQAEELPADRLAAYNAALITIVGAAACAAVRDHPAGCARWQLAGLATMPGQHVLARDHLRRYHRQRPDLDGSGAVHSR